MVPYQASSACKTQQTGSMSSFQAKQAVPAGHSGQAARYVFIEASSACKTRRTGSTLCLHIRILLLQDSRCGKYQQVLQAADSTFKALRTHNTIHDTSCHVSNVV
jgi:hypothetical protein